jgi:hypothetical protein
VIFRDNKQFDFIIINVDTFSIDDTLIVCCFFLLWPQKEHFCKVNMDASSFFYELYVFWLQNLGINQMIRKSKYLLIIYLLQKDVQGQS